MGVGRHFSLVAALALGCGKDGAPNPTPRPMPVTPPAPIAAGKVVAVSADGKVTVTEADGTLAIRKRSGSPVTMPRAVVAGAGVAGDAIAPSGTRLATVWQHTNGTLDVRVVEVPGGRVVWSRADFANERTYLMFSPDGAILAVRNGADITLVGAADGKTLRVVHPATPTQSYEPPLFSPSGKRIVASSSHRCFVADVATGRVLAELPGEPAAIPDDDRVVTINDDQVVKVFGVDGMLRVALDPLPIEAHSRTWIAPGEGVFSSAASTVVATRGELDALIIVRETQAVVWNGGKAVDLELDRPVVTCELGGGTPACWSGQLEPVVVPAGATATSVVATRYVDDPERMRAESAVQALIVDEPKRTRAGLPAFDQDAKQPRFRAAYHYATWVDGGRQGSLAEHLRRAGVGTTSPTALVELAGQLKASSALEVLTAWLQVSKRGDAAEEALGHDYVRYNVADPALDDDFRKLAVARFPDDVEIARAYLARFESPAAAVTAARAMALAHRSAAEWCQLYDEHLPELAGSDPGAKELALLERNAVKGCPRGAFVHVQASINFRLGTMQIGNKARALFDTARLQYTEAIRLAPGNEQYKTDLEAFDEAVRTFDFVCGVGGCSD